MEKILNSFFETVSREELAEFDAELGSIAKGSESDDTETVLSMSMHKSGLHRRRIKFKHRLIIMAAAVLILIPTTAAVAHRFDKLERFFGIEDGNSPYINEFCKREISVENDDAKMIVDGVLSDDLCTYILISFYAKNDIGRQHISDMRTVLYNEEDFAADEEFKDDPEEYHKEFKQRLDKAMKPYLNIQKGEQQYYDTTYNYVVYQEHKGAMWHDSERFFDKDNKNACYYKLVLDNKRLDNDKPLHLVEAFSGLKTDIDVSANVKMVRLVTDSPDGFHDVRLSPLGVFIRFNDKDTKHADEIENRIGLNAKLKGGKSAPVKCSSGTGTIVLDGRPFTHELWLEWGKDSFTDLMFINPINIEDFESIEIDGNVYRPVGTTK